MNEICDPSFALCDYKRGSLEKKCGRGDDDDVREVVSPFCNQLLRRDLAHCYMKKCAKCERWWCVDSLNVVVWISDELTHLCIVEWESEIRDLVMYQLFQCYDWWIKDVR